MSAVRVGGSGFVVGLWLISASAFAADSDGDGIVNPQDACKDEPETVNDYADLDGCPDELGRVRVVVKDLEGAPVPKAKVRLGPLTDFTGTDGSTVFTEIMPGTLQALRIEAVTYAVQEFGEIDVEEGESSQVVTLDWLPVAVRVQVRDSKTLAPVDAVVRVDGPGLVEPQRTGASGLLVVELRPGPWKMQVYADHYLRTAFDLPVKPSAEPLPLPVDLAPTWTTFPTLAVEFPPGGAELSTDAKAVLDGLAVELLAWTTVDLEVRGHSDTADEALDDARADAVVAWLQSRQVPVDRLYATGKGEGKGVDFRMVDPDEEVLLAQTVLFDDRSGVPTPDSDAVVGDLAALLRVHERVRVLVLGHATTGESATLADQRALVVAERLQKLGIEAGRLQQRGVIDLDSAPGFVELLVLPPVALKDRRVAFTAGSSEVTPDALPQIRLVAEALKRHPSARIKVLGVGAAGDGTAAGTIGNERAAKVVASLVAYGARRGNLVPSGITTRSPGAGFVAFELASLSMSETLPFDAGRMGMPADTSPLERVRQAMLEFPSATFEVRGYADDSRLPLASLAQTRAEAAMRWLVDRGADPARLTAVVGPADGPPGTARVEIVTSSGPPD